MDKIFNDLTQFADLKRQARSTEAQVKDASLREVAQQFEALFYQTMLKDMRNSVIQSDLFKETNDSVYRDMYDQQLALHAAGQQQCGLADVIYRQLGGTESDFRPQSAKHLQALTPHQAVTSEPASASIPTQSGHPVAQRGDDVQQNFIDQLLPAAQVAGERLGIAAEAILSVAGLESGWGQFQKGNNLFGIKADKGWQGQVKVTPTQEFEQGRMQTRQEPFRAYNSLQESVADFASFLLDNPRYQQALKAVNPQQFFQQLQQAGYATDPSYADKLDQVFRKIKQVLP